jgi:LmbE family N-acetylglucosaminyl deacetylase
MATRGERGTAGAPPLCSIDELPRVREAELREAARIVSFDAIHFLDYEDQQLANADGDGVRRKLVTLIRQHRPAVVVTFDPEGANRHPDHLAISRYTSDAIGAAADPRWFPQCGSPHTVARLLWTPPLWPWDVTAPDLIARAGVDFVVDTSGWWQQRRDALAAHRTQRAGIDRLFLGRADLERILSVEVFRQAFGPTLMYRPVHDVFDGME